MMISLSKSKEGKWGKNKSHLGEGAHDQNPRGGYLIWGYFCMFQEMKQGTKS